MEHTIIQKAFENAKRNQITNNPVIYMAFQRITIYWRDTYYILKGNVAEVTLAVQKCHEETNKNIVDDWYTEMKNLIDTPFDTYCGGGHQEDEIQDDEIQEDEIQDEEIQEEEEKGQNSNKQKKSNKCTEETKDKCCSQWFSNEFVSEEALQEFIKTIPQRITQTRARYVDIWDMTTTGLVLRQ